MPTASALTQCVELDLFQGPFDLLLTLLVRDEVDLLETPLADLVGQAVGERALERWDLEATSQLVLLLAALCDLKSRRMLGEVVDEEPDADAVAEREAMADRIVAYAAYRRAADWLGERALAAAGPRYRRVPLAAMRPAPLDGDPADLAAALTRLLAAPPPPSLDHMGPSRRPLPELIDRLSDALRRLARVSFERYTRGMDRREQALTLLAALELARKGEARLEQGEPFGDITIRPARP